MLHHLREEHDGGSNDFIVGILENFDEKPEDVGDADTNQLMGMIGLIVLGLGYGGIGYGSAGGISWVSFVLWGLSLIGLVAYVFSWWKFIVAAGDPTEWSTFSLWRWSGLTLLANGVVMLLSFIIFLVWMIIGGVFNWLTLGFVGGSLLFFAIAAYLMFYWKSWWYNFDDDGSSTDCAWDWFDFSDDGCQPGGDDWTDEGDDCGEDYNCDWVDGDDCFDQMSWDENCMEDTGSEW